MPCMTPPVRPIAIVCMVTPRSRARIGRLLGVERVRDGRLVVAVGQEHEDLFLGGRDQECLEPHGDRVADVGAVVPGRADRTAAIVSSRKAWSRIGGHARSG